MKLSTLILLSGAFACTALCPAQEEDDAPATPPSVEESGDTEKPKLSDDAEECLQMLETSHINRDEWLLYACQQHYSVAVLKKLVSMGAPVNGRDEDGRTALMDAPDAETARFLLSQGADVDLNVEGEWAAWDSVILTPDVLSELIRNKKLLTLKDSDGNSLLHVVVYRGMAESVKIILDAGADINALNLDRMTPLMYLLSHSYPYFDYESIPRDEENIVNLLIQRGANLNMATSSGTTMLMMVAENAHLLKVLLDHGADAKVKDARGRSAIIHAKLRARTFGVDSAEVIRLLREAGCGDDYTPMLERLLQAVKDDNIKEAEKLLAQGADVHGCKEIGCPIIEAAATGSVPMLKLLLAHGACAQSWFKGLNDDTTTSPLMVAAAAGHTDAVRVLLSHGAYPNSGQTSTALQMALINEKTETAEFLMAHGADVLIASGDDIIRPYISSNWTKEKLLRYVDQEERFRIYMHGLFSDNTEFDHDMIDGALFTRNLYLKRLYQLWPYITYGAPADFTLPEMKGNTALHYACALGRTKDVAELLLLGADPQKKTDRGATPRMCLSHDTRGDIAKMLDIYTPTPENTAAAPNDNTIPRNRIELIDNYLDEMGKIIMASVFHRLPNGLYTGHGFISDGDDSYTVLRFTTPTEGTYTIISNWYESCATWRILKNKRFRLLSKEEAAKKEKDSQR